MSYTDSYSDIEECGCGESSVKFKPVIGVMDQWWTTLINCQSEKNGYKLEYKCSNCGNVFADADPSMIASETVNDNYKDGKYYSADPNQSDLVDELQTEEAL